MRAVAGSGSSVLRTTVLSVWTICRLGFKPAFKPFLLTSLLLVCYCFISGNRHGLINMNMVFFHFFHLILISKFVAQNHQKIVFKAVLGVHSFVIGF